MSDTSNQAPQAANGKDMKEIVALCKRRGFVFPASDIYGGINGFWDYGPLGVELKNNLRDLWWKSMVLCPPIGPDGLPVEIVGLDSAIIQNPEVWVASGHVGGFADPMQTCRQCKKHLRADHVGDMLKESEWVKSFAENFPPSDAGDHFIVFNSGKAFKWAQSKGRKLAPGLALVRNPKVTMSWLAEDRQKSFEQDGFEEPMALGELLQYMATEQKAATGLQTPCPHCGGDLTEPKQFNLLFESHTGATQDQKVYLRGETAQGIFINYKNVLDSSRVRMPFGIAQVGKAFRNEVNPRNFIFRSREFEQMEMEWFCHPSEAKMWFDFWVEQRKIWWEKIGLQSDDILMRPHDQDELVFYSQQTYDIEYRFPFTAPGFGELEGIAYRTDYDLTQHQKHSTVKLEYMDPVTNEKFMPHVIEPAAGLTRGVLALLCEAFTVDPNRPSGMYMNFHPALAPKKAAILPLTAKGEHPALATKLYLELRNEFPVELDIKQNIGKRYARQDEIGTPYCFTIDDQTVSDNTVTVRERNTMAQERIPLDHVAEYLRKNIRAI